MQNILTDLTKDNLIFHQAVFPLQGDKISEFIDSIDKNSYSFIYYSKPFSDTEYLAAGKIYQIENSVQNISTIDEVISNFRENVTAGEIVEGLPTFFGYVKFPSTSKEKVWSDFNEVVWFIPQFLIFKRENKIHCAQNFFSSSADDDSTTNHIAEAQNFFQKITKQPSERKTSATIDRISEEDFSIWKKKVEEAISEIKENKLQKIVLARKVEYRISGEIIWSEIFEKLNSPKDCKSQNWV
ncbi:MAG: hypothetical protein ACK4UV_06600 [Ignavibacterium sp.]